MHSPLVQYLLAGVAAIGVIHEATASMFGSAIYSNSFGRPGVNATYDCVIIGGGTAGLTLAYRLTENSNVTVAVVEAGGFYEQENGNLTIVPGDRAPNLEGPLTNWNFTTAPQPQLENATSLYARGKTLGGSSAMNFMAYQRGTNDSYTTWAKSVGDESWNFQNLLPYFRRSTNYTSPNSAVRALNTSVPNPGPQAYGSTSGPIHVSFPNTATPFASWAQLGLREIGIPDIADFSSGALLGSQYCPLTIRPDDASRSSSESGYLQAAFARSELQPNLKVYTHTLGKKVIFDDNKTATGVVVKSAGISYLLSTAKEVILSAGAFQSPQLLMVSGVGPTKHLEEFDILIILDRPGVGQNMWDHVLWPMMYEVNLPTLATTQGAGEQSAVESYIQNQTGLLANSGGDYLAWEKIPKHYAANLSSSAKFDLAQFPEDWPDFEYIVDSAQSSDSTINFAELRPALITPISRGNVSLKSKDMEDAPVINTGWLTSPTDLEMAVIAIKRTRDFWATNAMKGVIIGDELIPGKNVSTDAQLLEWVKKNVQTVYHASCTCKMGKVEDPMAVVDSKARVIGLHNLRVVDAAAFPFLPPGHPQSTVYALAEKIADDILNER
ncbi:related to choline dehydrogenase [Rhynchosporium secalis]|uniref:Related to choline dehydrogenase n=1 Tax=Rhynchosporium secalis TaxID=38038 RepID=A0A1E1M2T5_RHYSE|nr:related to choline dehydrogenase [Rhynchosporium secalis]